jgi:hypothetical protein
MSLQTASTQAAFYSSSNLVRVHFPAVLVHFDMDAVGRRQATNIARHPWVSFRLRNKSGTDQPLDGIESRFDSHQKAFPLV